MILFVVGILAFAQTVYYPFVHDDVVFIVANPTIQTIDLGQIFLRTDADKTVSLINTYYRPMLDLLYRIEYRLFHFNPFGYHLVNVLLHAANGVLLFLILQTILRNLVLTFFTALVFLIHPIQSEAVSCIVGISNVLFVTFFFLSIFYYLKQDKNVVNFICSLVFFLAALFTKEQAVILPVLLVFYELVWTKRRKDVFKSISGHLVILCFYFVFRKMAVGQSGIDLGSAEELRLRLLSIPSTLLMYLQILFVPRGLHYYRSTDILLPYMLPMAALLGVFTLVFLSQRNINEHDRKIAGFGFGWFLITLLPTLNILPLVNEYSLILTSEHFLYLPMVGIFIAVAAYCHHFIKNSSALNKPVIIGGMMIVLSLTYFSLTVRQNTYWRSEVALFERMMAYEKNFARGHMLLGRAYYFDLQLDKAVEEYLKGEERMKFYISQVSNADLKKFYEGFLKEIYFEIAHVYQQIGNDEQTLSYYKKLIELDPYFGKGFTNLGVFYASKGEFDKAMDAFLRASTLDPYDPVVWQNLFMMYRRNGDEPNAQKAFEMLKRFQKN